MSKGASKLNIGFKGCKSSFTLTFAIEVIGIDVWHDCNEGWLDLGPPAQGMRIQYQLYPGQNYDLDILIWPHAAKVFYGANYCWVRTWQFLERRWLAFSIRHVFTVRVAELRDFTASVNPSVGLGSISSNAKGDKSSEVYLPRLEFGQRRYFAPVLETEKSVSLEKTLEDLVWSCVEKYIPKSIWDDLFDIPQLVTDVRLQDAVIYYVQEAILKPITPDEPDLLNESDLKIDPKNKDKKKVEKEVNKAKFEIKLSGDTIIAGTGRITLFERFGEKPQDFGEFIVLISSSYLPAEDDHPVIFVNVGKIMDMPVNEFIKQKITHVYTKWSISDEDHVSAFQAINQLRTEINFNDHHTIIMPFQTASEIISVFLEGYFKIELRGIRQPLTDINTPSFFGYEKEDSEFGKRVALKIPVYETDILIAVTKIDARLLLKAPNAFIRAEYPLYPPETSVVYCDREEVCTNDINAIRAEVRPKLIVQPGIILEAQMTLEVSMGVVGCKPKKMQREYSRLFSLVRDSDAVLAILHEIAEINEDLMQNETLDDFLTGFCIDTGDTAFLFVEGPRNGKILQVWDVTTEYYPKLKPVFSTADKYRCRLYPELLLAPMPFNVLKMYVPLSLILACPSIYARPALPLLTKSALLKIGRLLASERHIHTLPSYDKMPTAMELKSFRLELCVAPRPPPVPIPEVSKMQDLSEISQKKLSIQDSHPMQSPSRVIWETKHT